MAQLIADFDWSQTVLGPMDTWPQHLRTAVNIVLDSPVPMVMLWGKDGIMIYNDAYSAFAGGRHPGLLGSKVVEGWPEVADFNKNVMKQGLAGKTLSYEDQRMTLLRNGKPEEVWVNLNYSPVRDDKGKPAGVLAIVNKTTDGVLAKEAFQSERSRLYRFFGQAPAAIAVVQGPEHRYELANSFYQKITNRTENELLGRSIKEVFPEFAGQGVYEVFDTVLSTGEPFVAHEFPAIFDRTGTGSMEKGYFNFVAQPIENSHGKVERILIHAVEVTEQVLARQKVKESEEQFRIFANNIQNLAWMASPEGEIYWCNQEWYDYTGTNLEEMQGWGWEKVHHPEHVDRVVEFVKKAWKMGETWELTFPLKGSDGQYRWFLTRAYAVKDATGKVIRWIGTNTNIDEQKKAEDALKELNVNLERRIDERTEELTAANKELSRSNVELQDFAYVASHDLQEPLRKIIAFAGLLESDYKKELPADARVYITGLQKSSTRMRTLIDDLLTYSRVATKEQPFKQINLNSTVKIVLEDLQTRINETSATIETDKLCAIEGDPLQIRLLLQNLISNALKYKQEGVAPVIRISSVDTDEDCTISIADNGIGFDEQYIDKIFTIFQRLHGRTAYEGTGVGLAICKKIVDRHGGTITAKSKEGEGSTFIVTLPKKQRK
ncbi:MAG TPA: PAS domain-containing protein [Candidatus Limnocylindrales bacterium]|nr:PAS domain-containing protein [Candidatus Limnocylindrales bacterium]